MAGVWDAPIFFPYHDTLAFSENLFGVAVFAAPVYWLSGNPLLAYGVAFLASFVVAGAGMYMLAREVTGSRAAACVGAAVYTFGPFRMTQIAHIQMIATGWLPIGLWALHRYTSTREPRWAIGFTLAWIVQTLSNSYVGYFMLLPAVAVAAHGLWRTRGAVRATAVLLTAAACGAVALMPVALAYYRVRSAYRQVRDPLEIARGGADVRSYLVVQNHVGVWRWLPTAVITDPEKELFPGLIAPLLALAALSRRDRTARLYGAIAAAGFVLSLGPHVHVWGRVVTTHGPYAWLLRAVPGMDGMRVPARFAIVVVAALAVLAASGTRAIAARLPARTAAITTGVLVAAAVAEGFAVPLPTEPYPARARPEDRAVASWLNDRTPGAVLHLPLTADIGLELNHQYATLWPGHPIVNGFSGYAAPLQDFLRNPSSPLFDLGRYGATIEMLRSIGVRYVVVHAGDFSPSGRPEEDAASTIDAIRASGKVAAEMRALRATMFELAPVDSRPLTAGSPAVTPIARSGFALTASEGADRLGSIADGNPDSRWMAGMRGQDGSSWIAARFEQPTDVARVELQLADRSLVDYPRQLRIEVSDTSDTVRVLYDEPPYPELAASILRDPRYPVLAFNLPPNRTTTLTMRQTGATRRAWSVHELRLWRR